MAEALVFSGNNTHPDPEKDRRGCWKRGYIVVVKPDGHPWGREEDPATANPRKFALLKFPGVSVERVEKYMAGEYQDGILTPFRRRLWQIQWSELPLAARQKLQNEGVLVIGSGGDYTWTQVRNFFMRLDTTAREVEAM